MITTLITYFVYFYFAAVVGLPLIIFLILVSIYFGLYKTK